MNILQRLLAFFASRPAVSLNTGVAAPLPQKPTDWVAGLESGITKDVVNISGDWTPYVPTGRWQKLMGVPYNGGNGFDTLACVTFSALECLETQMNFQLSLGLISAENALWLKENGYIDANGKVGFSARFTAKMDGTTQDGNWYDRVWDSIRNNGLLPDSDWPFPNEAIAAYPQNAWKTYYAEIPQALKDKAQAFRAHFTTQYEWVKYQGKTYIPFSDALKVAPLHIVTAVCPPWNTAAPINGCGMGGAHGTCLLRAGNGYDIFDQYVPFVKHFAPNYDITYAVRGVISEVIVSQKPDTFRHTFTSPYQLGDTDPELILLQNFLKIEGFFPLTVASNGHFGNITAQAVLKFQLARGVDTPAALAALGGRRIGSKTLGVINTIISS